MKFKYDTFGWYAGQAAPVEFDRTTPVSPGDVAAQPVEGEPWPNWDGNAWIPVPYVAPPNVTDPEPESDPRLWWVDVGPFKDRLGMDIGAIASSQHSACLGVKEFLNGRKYVNLRDPKVSLLLDVMIANNQPAADPVWPGSGPITVAKKAVILDTPTTEEERHIKGLEG